MEQAPDIELIDVEDMSVEAFNDMAEAFGWSDGMPLFVPTVEAVDKLVETVHGDNEPIGPVPPRLVNPTMRSLAANAVMAGCKPEYFPAVVTALRSCLAPEYNLSGILATTHPCTNMAVMNGPIRNEIALNCGSNCFGQGWRANAAIGRALQLIMLNVAGARPAVMDRATQGSPGKYAFCFGENEEESPWEPYHVRKGFAAADSTVTTMAAEPPHNINDHGSNSGKGILKTIAGTMSQAGANNTYLHGPVFVVFGPEHAQTVARDGFTVEQVQEYLFDHSKVHVSRISDENLESWAGQDRHAVQDHYHPAKSPTDIQIVVAGGAGKHSAFIPSFGNTAASSSIIRKP
ncbi:MAG: hypothetical protein ACR2PI_11435 [Hyphomicrobiaceae bacterium]